MTTKPNSPEALAICRRVGEEDRKKYGRIPFLIPESAKKKRKPSSEWKQRAKITSEIVADVRRMLDEGKSTNEIARRLDICQTTVSRIKRGAGRYGKID